MNKIVEFLVAMVLATFSVSAFAIPTYVSGGTCGSPDRTATSSNASECVYDSGTNFNNASDILGIYPGDAWTAAGEITANGTDNYFSATSVDGWGNIPNSGTWTIDSDFWTAFDEAVISMHIGQGNGNPDTWAWAIITPADLTADLGGTWSLSFISTLCDGSDDLSCAGGGLSNLKLWGRGDGTTVSEPGIVALLAIGLLGLAVTRRKMKV